MTRQPAAGSSRHLFTEDQRIFVRFQPTVLFLLLFLGLSTAASLFMGQSVLAAGRTVQIRLRACGGEVSKTSAEVSARGSIGRLPVARRSGYKFKGWYTKKLEGEKVTRSTAVSSLATRVLYAHYEPITYRIRFRKNGILDEVPETMVCTYGESYRLPEMPGTALDHWSTSKRDRGTTYKAGKKIKNLTAANGKVITLYAIGLSGKNNIEKLMKYFVRQGFTKEAAAGIAGNLMYESGGGPGDIRLNAVEYSTGRGIGMVQWTDTSDGPRRTNFERYCASRGKPWPNQDLQIQIDFLMQELEGTYGKIWAFLPRMGYPAKYKMTLEAFKRCKNVSKATWVFCANFERPYANDCGIKDRILFAKIALRYL